MSTRIRYIILLLALIAPAFVLGATVAAQHRNPSTSDTQAKGDDGKKTDDKAVKRDKAAERRDTQEARRRADENKKRQAAERRDHDGNKDNDRGADRHADDKGDQHGRPRPPLTLEHPRVVERTRVVFVGGYFYDPAFGRYPWWSPIVYPHYQIFLDTRAQVRLQVTPRTAAVYVDGFYAGVVDDFDGFFERLPLLPGGHTITLYLEGFRTLTRSIYLSPGSELRIREDMLMLLPGEASEPPAVNAMLPPPPPGSYMPPHTAPSGQPRPTLQASNPAPGFGILSLRFRPIDAMVTIDGQEWLSSAPGELVVHLGVGTHVIALRAPGYRLFSTDVEIRDGETAEVNVAAPRQTTW